MEVLRPEHFEGYTLPVMEIFETIQGEGFHAGKAALFIRLAGCDIGCNWCDSKASWDAKQWPPKTLGEILNTLREYNLKDVIVSGGEPLQNDLEPLTFSLKQNGYTTYLETSGSCKITGTWDWICLSPKMCSPPLQSLYPLANELKVVVSCRDDFFWAENQASHIGDKCFKYLQPEWSVRNVIIPEIVSYIIKNPSWILSLQSHKYIGIP